jgi:hypothetical protein
LVIHKTLLLNSHLKMSPLLSGIQHTPGLCKGITIIGITAHGFINRRFAATPDADGVFGLFIATAATHTNAQSVYVSDLLGMHRTGRLRAVKFKLPP